MAPRTRSQAGKEAALGAGSPALGTGSPAAISLVAAAPHSSAETPGSRRATQRRAGAGGRRGVEEAASPAPAPAPAPGGSSVRGDLGNMALLVLLYMLQGVPLGLTVGAMPLLLQSKLSYSQMGIFALASYPYSLKLLWSPIVDCMYWQRIGRRKSWILPLQSLTGLFLLLGAGTVQRYFDAADVWRLTAIFFTFEILCATQDVAVDGWALSLLSPPNVGYASTCQTLGLNTGYFTSFTLFLALNNPQFCDRYIRAAPLLAPLLPRAWAAAGTPLLTLQGYMQFWGAAFLAFTLFIALCKPERAEQPEEGSGEGKQPAGGSSSSGWGQIRAAYGQLWQVVKLPAVLRLGSLLLTYRIALTAAESAASLKLIDKGMARETLALMVLVQFPVELLSALLAGRWAAAYTPYPPFMIGYVLRNAAAVGMVALAWAFPPSSSPAAAAAASPAAAAAGGSSLAPYFAALLGLSLAQSFASTLTFNSLGTLFNNVSDPAMGGAYLTLLNTISNLGYTVPKTPIFYLMDLFTINRCVGQQGGAALPGLSAQCPKKASEAAGANACTAAGGTCVPVTDGFYLVSCASTLLFAATVLAYARLLPALLKLPLASWRASPSAAASSGAGSSKRSRRRSTVSDRIDEDSDAKTA